MGVGGVAKVLSSHGREVRLGMRRERNKLPNTFFAGLPSCLSGFKVDWLKRSKNNWVYTQSINQADIWSWRVCI